MRCPNVALFGELLIAEAESWPRQTGGREGGGGRNFSSTMRSSPFTIENGEGGSTVLENDVFLFLTIGNMAPDKTAR